jgi:hypothetical protein
LALYRYSESAENVTKNHKKIKKKSLGNVNRHLDRILHIETFWNLKKTQGASLIISNVVMIHGNAMKPVFRICLTYYVELLNSIGAWYRISLIVQPKSGRALQIDEWETPL